MKAELERQVKEEMEDQVKQGQMLDKVLNVYLSDFSTFPKVVNGQEGVAFQHPSKHHSALNVAKSRQEYFGLRLAIAEERVFSHGKYLRAKLTYSEEEKATRVVVHKVHAVLGSS